MEERVHQRLVRLWEHHQACERRYDEGMARTTIIEQEKIAFLTQDLDTSDESGVNDASDYVPSESSTESEARSPSPELREPSKRRPGLDESSDQDSDECPATNTKTTVKRSSKPDGNEPSRRQKRRPGLDESSDQDSDECPATNTKTTVKRLSKPDGNEPSRRQKRRPGLDESSNQDSDECPAAKITVKKCLKGVKQKWNPRHYCIYCKKPQSQIVRHLERKHKKEEDVARATSFSKYSKKRRLLFAQIRHKGDYNHDITVLQTGKGEIVTYRQPSEEINPHQYLLCNLCYGFFKKRELWKHEACKMTNDPSHKKSMQRNRVQTSASCLIPKNGNATERCSKIISRMNHDEVSLEVKDDKLICEYGDRLLEKYGSDPSKDGNVLDEIGLGLEVALAQKHDQGHSSEHVMMEASPGQELDECPATITKTAVKRSSKPDGNQPSKWRPGLDESSDQDSDEPSRRQNRRPGLDESIDQDSDECPATITKTTVKRSSKPDGNGSARKKKFYCDPGVTLKKRQFGANWETALHS